MVEHHAGVDDVSDGLAGVDLLQVGQVQDVGAVVKQPVGLGPELLVPPTEAPHGAVKVVPDAPVLQQLRGCEQKKKRVVSPEGRGQPLS